MSKKRRGHSGEFKAVVAMRGVKTVVPQREGEMMLGLKVLLFYGIIVLKGATDIA